MNNLFVALSVGAALTLTGCASTPQNYEKFRASRPKSVLVIPPLNQSTDLNGSYSCLSSLTRPIADMGYYVFPVVLVHDLFRENGLPNPPEMHQASLKKIKEIINPDAVLYVSIVDYGTKFQILNSTTRVSLEGRLVDTKTGEVIWQAHAWAAESANSDGNSGLAGMLVTAVASQVVSSATDHAEVVCRKANFTLIQSRQFGFILGHRHPKFPADFADD